jgi:hypothetical protein
VAYAAHLAPRNSDGPRQFRSPAQFSHRGAILIARANSLIAHASAPQLATSAAAAIADAAVGGSAMP